jgi:hypothetical protein
MWKHLSSLDEGTTNPAFKNDKEIAEFERNLRTDKLPLAQLSTELREIIKNKKELFKKTLDDLATFVKKDLRKYNKTKFMYQIKSIESIIDKAVVRKKGLLALNDLVRGAVLLETKEDADDYVKTFIRKNKSSVIWYEEKQRGQDKEYGYYGSHHIDLIINGLVVELQVMTKKLWSYKEAAHQIYNANRSKQDGSVSKEDQYDSKKIFSLGNKKKYVRESFTDEELGEMIYDDWKTLDLE